MIFPVVYLLTPYTSLVQDPVVRYGCFLSVMLLKGLAVIVAFPCTTIMLTNSASSVRILGTLNGYATSFSGIGRAVGPALTGAVFSVGVQRGYVIASWWLLAGIAMLGAVPAWFIIEGEGPTRSLDADSDAEEDTLVSDDEDRPEVALIEGVSDGESESGAGTDDSSRRCALTRTKQGYGSVSPPMRKTSPVSK